LSVIPQGYQQQVFAEMLGVYTKPLKDRQWPYLSQTEFELRTFHSLVDGTATIIAKPDCICADASTLVRQAELDA
jgi:hypothetical protein